MEKNWLSAQEIIERNRDVEFLKYVRVGDEFRFADSTATICPRHDSAIKPQEWVKSAGFLTIRDNSLKISGYSMTLNVGPCEDDYVALACLFNMPCD